MAHRPLRTDTRSSTRTSLLVFFFKGIGTGGRTGGPRVSDHPSVWQYLRVHLYGSSLFIVILPISSVLLPLPSPRKSSKSVRRDSSTGNIHMRKWKPLGYETGWRSPFWTGSPFYLDIHLFWTRRVSDSFVFERICVCFGFVFYMKPLFRE